MKSEKKDIYRPIPSKIRGDRAAEDQDIRRRARRVLRNRESFDYYRRLTDGFKLLDLHS